MDARCSSYAGIIGAFSGTGSAFWRLFSSLQLALVLMLVLVGLGLIGALLIQVPREIVSSPAEYAYWLETVAEPKVGFWAKPLSFLYLFDVFHSPWFLTAGALLVVNILVCTLKRSRGLLRAAAGGPVRQAAGFYSSGSRRLEFAEVPVAPAEAVNSASRMLKRHRYRVRTESSSGRFYVAADKNRYAVLGTYLTHLSIILAMIGLLVGTYAGFRNPHFIVPEGSIRDVGYGTGLSLGLEEFVDEYWSDGTPRDYRSQVVIYENGEEVDSGVIRVNHPMTCSGVGFCQSFFGPSVVMEVQTGEGDVLWHDGIAMSGRAAREGIDYPFGAFTLAEAGLTMHILGAPANQPNSVVGKDEIALGICPQDSRASMEWTNLGLGKSCELQGLRFIFLEEGQYSGFSVSRDRGSILIWIASGLFLLGVVAVFCLPHRQLWAIVEPRAQGSSRVVMRLPSGRGPDAVSECQYLKDHLGSELAFGAPSGEEQEDHCE